MGFGAALAAAVAGAAAGAGVIPARWSAAAPSETDGSWIVAPRATRDGSLRPLAAASERVVKLLAAAIDHMLSPGWTTWGTLALAAAGKIASTKKEIVSRGRRRMRSPSPRRGPATSGRADLRRPAGAGPRRRHPAAPASAGCRATPSPCSARVTGFEQPLAQIGLLVGRRVPLPWIGQLAELAQAEELQES